MKILQTRILVTDAREGDLVHFCIDMVYRARGIRWQEFAVSSGIKLGENFLPKAPE